MQGKELELASRIVREDLLLLRPGEDGFQLAAGCALCAFDLAAIPMGTCASELRGPTKAGEGADGEGWSTKVKRATRLLATEKAAGGMVSWSDVDVRPTGRLLHRDVVLPVVGTVEGGVQEDESFDECGGEARGEVGPWLHVEYNTLRLLPASGYLAMTVRTLADPLQDLAIDEEGDGAEIAQDVRERLVEQAPSDVG